MIYPTLYRAINLKLPEYELANLYIPDRAVGLFGYAIVLHL
jgi:hypothetical protein